MIEVGVNATAKSFGKTIWKNEYSFWALRVKCSVERILPQRLELEDFEYSREKRPCLE